MRFSIFMCTYNSSETLRYAIDSVRKQTFADWEFLILDNGSDDDSADIVREFEKIDNRIIGIYRQDNVGWPKGISICLEKACGEYMMFLGADDFLADDYVFEEVNSEILKYHPDIIWTGYSEAEYKDGQHHIIKQHCPEYRVYYGKKHKIRDIADLMKTVYYNSVMHYVKIELLKKNGIDFFDPYYGDCMGMTEAMCRADVMVALDKSSYVLTGNTSQTSGRVNFDYDVEQQWKSIQGVINDCTNVKREDLQFISARILSNLKGMYEMIALGGELRDCWMNPIHRGLTDRFLKLEKWLSTDAFGEMIYLAGESNYEEELLLAAGILFMACIKRRYIFDMVCKESMWLADLLQILFDIDAEGNVRWRLYFEAKHSQKAVKVLENKFNKNHIGRILLLKDDITYGKKEDRDRIEAFSGRDI